MSAQDFDGSAGLPDGVKPASSARPQEILNVDCEGVDTSIQPQAGYARDCALGRKLQEDGVKLPMKVRSKLTPTGV